MQSRRCTQSQDGVFGLARSDTMLQQSCWMEGEGEEEEEEEEKCRLFKTLFKNAISFAKINICFLQKLQF